MQAAPGSTEGLGTSEMCVQQCEKKAGWTGSIDHFPVMSLVSVRLGGIHPMIGVLES